MSAAVRHFARRKGRLFLDGVHEGFRWQLIWPMLAIGVGTAVLGYGWFVAGIVALAYVVGEGRGRDHVRRKFEEYKNLRDLIDMRDAERRRKATVAFAELRRARDAGELDEHDERVLAAWERLAARHGAP